MWHWDRSASVEQNLQDFVIIRMGRQEQGRDISGKDGGVPIYAFPALEKQIIIIFRLEIPAHFVC